MKAHARLLILTLVFRQVLSQSHRSNPTSQVATLLEGLKQQVEKAGGEEQQQYDKFACWCEKTFANKTAEISQAELDIEDLTNRINGYSAEIGQFETELKNIQQDIRDMDEQMKDATTVRKNRLGEYKVEVRDNEHCIQALNFAIETLTGAGTAEANFLGTNQQVQMHTAASRVGRILERPLLMDLSEKDISMVRRFVQNPDGFVGGMSAVQISNNPHGDYAPQSTVITGILKAMHDGFTQDNMKISVTESTQKTEYDEYMRLKNLELATLKSDEESTSTNLAGSKSNMNEAKEQRTATEAQLKADKEFLAATRDACKVKAEEWSDRTRCRTVELQGMEEALTILYGVLQDQQSQARQNVSFLQVGSISAAMAHVKSVATKFHHADLLAMTEDPRAKAAAIPEAGYGEGTGFFDKVLAKIDGLVAQLREEAQDDIRHRDACQQWEAKNKMDSANQAQRATKLQTEAQEQGDRRTELNTEATTLGGKMTDANRSLTDLNENRVASRQQFQDQVGFLLSDIKGVGSARAALAKFYQDQKLEELQTPTYDNSDKTQLDTNLRQAEFSECGSAHGESHGILAILDMIIEDMERELQTAREADAAEEADYRKQRAKIEAVIKSIEDALAENDQAKADLQDEMDRNSEEQGRNSDAQTARGDSETAAAADCSWVENFGQRKTERENNINALIAAKGSLGGACDKNAVLN